MILKTNRKFVKSIEIIPPRCKIDKILIQNIIKNQKYFDYLDIACCPMANLRISPLAFAHNLIIKGADYKKIILNFSTRDKNTLALQSEILGAHSMKLNKVLLVKGDPIKIGNSRNSKEVFEVSTNSLIKIVNNLNKGKDFAGNKLNFKAQFVTGSTINIDNNYKSIKSTISKRVKIGSDFFITQPLYTDDDFEKLIKLSKNKEYKILGGILPIKNKKTLFNMKNKINGITKGNKLFEILSKSKESDFVNISTDFFLKSLEKYKRHLDGIHIMTSGDIKLAVRISKVI
tara:strand:- start:42 stop:905 length:864 start_codon:yes stop_codon:yes gene_type:complete